MRAAWIQGGSKDPGREAPGRGGRGWSHASLGPGLTWWNPRRQERLGEARRGQDQALGAPEGTAGLGLRLASRLSENSVGEPVVPDQESPQSCEQAGGTEGTWGLGRSMSGPGKEQDLCLMGQQLLE